MRGLIIAAIAASALSSEPCLAGSNIWTFEHVPSNPSWGGETCVVSIDVADRHVSLFTAPRDPALNLTVTNYKWRLHFGSNYRLSISADPGSAPLYLTGRAFPDGFGIGASADGDAADRLGNLMGSTRNITISFLDGDAPPWIIPTDGIDTAFPQLITCTLSLNK
jgi:hypothetical protein